MAILDEILASLQAENPALTEITLVGGAINDKSCQSLIKELSKHGELLGITQINLSNNHLNDVRIAEILSTLAKYTPNLSSLNISGNRIEDKGVKALIEALEGQKFLNLENLDISACGIGDEVGSILSSELSTSSSLRGKTYLPKLKSFNVGDNLMHKTISADLKGNLNVIVGLAAKTITHSDTHGELIRAVPSEATSGVVASSLTRSDRTL